VQARTAKGLSQKDLATKLMIPAKTIQDYENGKAVPNNALIAKIERNLGCKVSMPSIFAGQTQILIPPPHLLVKHRY